VKLRLGGSSTSSAAMGSTPSILTAVSHLSINDRFLQGRVIVEGIFRSSSNHTVSLLFLAALLGPAVDNFFEIYAGGLPGMKGYPFYSQRKWCHCRTCLSVPAAQRHRSAVFQFLFQQALRFSVCDVGRVDGVAYVQEIQTGRVPNSDWNRFACTFSGSFLQRDVWV
jgi:hypothetical protein